MNATTLSGSLRTGSIRRRAPAPAPRPALLDALPAPVRFEECAPLSVEKRADVWCVVAADGAPLAPCASREVATRHAAALSRLASLSRP